MIWRSDRFGSTYVCEQIFSIMNISKLKYRLRLTDMHQKHPFMLTSSKTNPKKDDLIKKLKIQKPH